jgi:hypothetical protein
MITGSGVAKTLEVTGAAMSILTSTEAELDRPAPFVAEQVTVLPRVGALKTVGPQLVDEEMPDSGSLTFQVTVTGVLLFQPEPFGMGLTVGMIKGGVVSAPGGLIVSVIGWLIRLVFPAASEMKTDA